MKRFLTSVTLFAIIASVISLFAASPTSQAQRPTPTTIVSPTPTADVSPTPNTGASSHPASKKDSAPPQEGAVWGYVIDYSNGGAPQAGVSVVLDGGGWSAETVSDSNGFYKFAGLGSGEARLRLKLPPEAHAVNENWRIHTGSASQQATNLGFYWGDTPPLPVIASAEASKVAAGQTASLKVTVKNQSGGDAHNLLVTVSLPPELTAANPQPANDGTVDIADHRVTIQLDALPDGEKATFTVAANAADTLPDALSAVDVSLVYDEQLTPQQISVNLQPGNAGTGTTATESVIPETGGAQNNTTPATTVPIAILAVLFVIGLAYAGIRGFSRRS